MGQRTTMRHRIVCEMVQNEELYLDNKYLKNGMNPNGNVDVAKTFASYSSLYMGTRLNKKSIRELYEQEALSIGKNGTYMGMWQLASLANILSCPVVSVYPEYGSRTVRNDMHRVFYPVKREHSENERVYIMWTNSNGALVPEKEFSVNHFVVLMQLTTNSTNAFDLDCSFDDVHDSSMTLEDDSYDAILDVLNHLDVDMEVSEEITSISDENRHSASKHTAQQSPSDHNEMSPSDHIEMSPSDHIEMSPRDHIEMSPSDHNDLSPSDHIEMSLSDHIEMSLSDHIEMSLSDHIENPIDQTEQLTRQQTKTSFSEPEQHPSNQTGQPLSNQTGQPSSNQTGQSASNQTGQSPSNQTGQSPTDDIEMSPISSDQTEQPTRQQTKTSFSEPEQHPSNQTGQPPSNQTGQPSSNQTGYPPSNQTGQSARNQTVQSASDEIEMLPSAETVQTLNAVTRQPQILDTEQLVRICRALDYKYRGHEFDTHLAINCVEMVHGMFSTDLSRADVDEWPWVTFFKKYRTYTWVMNDIKHTILESDVQKKLEPPDVSKQGRRLLYTFDGLQ